MGQELWAVLGWGLLSESPTSPPGQMDTGLVLRGFWAELQLWFGLEGTSKLLSFHQTRLFFFVLELDFVLEISSREKDFTQPTKAL